MLTITVDSNIYISALGFGGVPLRILEMAVDGDIRIATSSFIQEEVVRALRTKLQWDEARVREAESFMIALPVPATGASRTADVVKDDPTDNRILECALESGSEFVVTDDRHLLRLGEYEGIRIVRAADFLHRGE